MKTIVIAGAHSNTGKTTLGLAIRGLLPGAALVKLGTGESKPNNDVPLYPVDTPFDEIAAEHSEAPYLIIESNAVLDELVPDLTIFLPGEGEDKPSAAKARDKADILRGERIPCPKGKALAGRLDLTPGEFCGILDAAGVRVCDCEFGIF